MAPVYGLGYLRTASFHPTRPHTKHPKTLNRTAVLYQLIQRCGGGTWVRPEESQLALRPPSQSN